MNLNIVLLGASGDLANKKILPAIGEFIHFNEDMNINLIPWGRKESDITKITESLNLEFKSGYTISQSIESDYNNTSVISEFVDNNPEALNIFYLSLPPVANYDFIEALTKVSSRNFEIIIEKPFATSIEEFRKIDDLVIKSRLQNKINYLDHYLFKDTYNYNPTVTKFLSGIQHRKLVQAHISIQEKLDIQSRIGFYDTTGCVNDMFFHTFNIFNSFYNSITGEEKKLVPSEIKILSLIKGQYESYASEVGKPTNTETAFQLILEDNGINITMESSKKMDTKLTQLEVQFDDSSQLTWNIHPLANIEYFSKASFMSINLKTNHSDHYNIFCDLTKGKKNRFLDSKNILMAYTVLDKLNKDKGVPKIY
jgi:glucose-6-phosphate 1-dehydrogenase